MKTPRTYSIFTKCDGKWVRLSHLALPLKAARSHWQSALLHGSMTGKPRELRPAKNLTLTEQQRREFYSEQTAQAELRG